jgi:hypothetical protein
MGRIFLLIAACVLLSSRFADAQQKDYEIKVISKNLQNVKGLLQKVGPEGIAVEDYKGNYLIFRAKDIVKIKVRHRGLTIWKGTVNGALVGAGILGGLVSISPEDSNDKVYALGALLAVGATAVGTVSGLIAEGVNTKAILYVDGNQERYLKGYKKLDKYVRIVPTERL